MRTLISVPMAMIACLLFANASAAEPKMHRYLIVRTFPAGALAGLDAATKAKFLPIADYRKAIVIPLDEMAANADEFKKRWIAEVKSEL